MKRAFLSVLVAICCISVAAQERSKPSSASGGKAPQQQGMQMPAPAPEMTKLIKSMSGTWTVTEKHYPNPMEPNGGTGKGTATLTSGPGNRSLIEKYHTVGAMGSFNAIGTFWWDSKAQAYRGVWCDNMIPDGCDGSGTTKWEGDNLVGTMEMEMNGQKMTTRFTYSDWKPNSFLMTMEMGPDPSSMKKAMTVTYTKASAGTAMQKTTP